MKRLLVLFLIVCLASNSDAQRRSQSSATSHSRITHSSSTYSRSSHSKSSSVYVKPYTKKDGTYVGGYYRSASSSKNYTSSHSTKSSGSRGVKSASRRSNSSTSISNQRSSEEATGVQRDNKGKIRRNEAAKKTFMKQTGYPHGRPGYVIDHIIPLSRGGKDDPSDMQWQTIADAKAKDKWERGQSNSKKKTK